jgi:hypothetical protein
MKFASQFKNVSCGTILLLLTAVPATAQERLIDLRKWGYKPRENKAILQQFSQFISVGAEGQVAVGFVTRERFGLATRALPPLSFHIIRFDRQGVVLDQHEFPTASWTENSIFFGPTGGLLVRTGEKVRLFSAKMELVTERALSPTKDSPIISWKISRSPDASNFLFYNFRREQTSIELVDSLNLALMSSCPFNPYDRVTSVSDQSISFEAPSPANDHLLRKTIVSKVCGPIQYEYTWHGEPLHAVLVADKGLLLAGTSSQIKFVGPGGKQVLWEDSFEKHHDQVTDNVQTSADGEILVVVVKTFSGSRLLDSSLHLKRERLVVYRTGDGKRLKEIEVHPEAPLVFGFSLSSDGKTLAVLADENVHLISID